MTSCLFDQSQQSKPFRALKQGKISVRKKVNGVIHDSQEEVKKRDAGEVTASIRKNVKVLKGKIRLKKKKKSNHEYTKGRELMLGSKKM